MTSTNWPSWVADNIHIGVIITDLSGQLLHLNKWAIKHGHISEKVIGDNIKTIFPDIYEGRVGLAFKACCDFGLPSLLSHSLNPEPFPLFADELQRDAGMRIQQSVRITRVNDGDQPLVVLEIHDVSNAVKRERLLLEQATMLKKVATTDMLTGLPNRRVLEDIKTREYKRAKRNSELMAIILIDIDLFKPYNDTYGHPAGDRCLQQVAECLRAELRRPMDVAARFGGEEFIIVLPQTDLQGAVAVAERLRASVQSLDITHSGSGHGVVTISQGVISSLPSEEFSFEQFIAQADVALYAAKRGGRNRVALAQSAAVLDHRTPPSSTH